MSITSTLVETVSIDYEDFNESFLTCGTCLCMFDASEHCPKLLPCSHTICLDCLIRIVATFARDTGQFRCPICRELITIPQGGVQALPPSFLVNQLLDLMARQRREVIPKCSTHQNQELLFCETCDLVFCSLCTGGTHTIATRDTTNNTEHMRHSTTSDHTVIPFSIAIKRMSEILLYKANECTAKLNEASQVVTSEIHRLDHKADSAFEDVNAVFEIVAEAVKKRRQEVLSNVRRKRDEKRKILDDQLHMIQAEKSKVDTEVKSMQSQVEVRNITKKISDLNSKLDIVSQLSEPRENSYIEFIRDESATYLDQIGFQLEGVGKIKTSKTFPPLCRATMNTAISHLETTATLQTIDYNGIIQNVGGDPVKAEVIDEKGDPVDTCLIDLEDGTYLIRFTASHATTYCLKISIFDRPIKDCPLFFEVTEHNSPLISYGMRGVKEKGFVQPCALTVDDQDNVYVVDTGNSRIKVLSGNLDYQNHITNECLEGRSVTGVCLGGSGDSLITVNWRSKMITEISLDGHTIGAFSHDDLVEPIAVAINNDGEVLVADNGVGAIMVFETSGKLLRKIGKKGNKKGEFKEISSLCVSHEGDIIVADTRIIVFNSGGEFIKEIGCFGKESPKGRYSGLATDRKGFLLAARMEKAKSYVQVFNLSDGSIYSVIDSHGSKLKRPTGVATSTKDTDHLYVVDIAHDCVRKYRYC